MPDNKQKPEAPENTEPTLSDLISSAKEKIQNTEAASENTDNTEKRENTDNADNGGKAENTADGKEDKQDKKDKKDKQEKNEDKTKIMPAMSERFSNGSDTGDKQDIPDKTDRSDMPDISFKSAEADEGKSAESADGVKPDEEQKNEPKPEKEKKPPDSKPAVKSNNEPAKKASQNMQNKSKKAAAKPAEKTKTPKKAAAEKPADGAKTDKTDKAKFTKKQVLTVVGLIASLLLVLALIVVLLFNYYYSLLDTKKQTVNNSKPMTYSDVDLSLADTVDKSEEDEKLKELISEGEKISSKEVMNILLIGEDLRDTESGDSGNTDVMMIISVNTKDKTITMTSIMRDCYVYIPGWYSTRINAAYWHGGVDLTKETIESYMNVKIDRYVLVNFKTFIDIVDTLGGLDITVTDEEANGYADADPNGENTRGMQNPLDEQNKYLGNKKGTDYIKKGGDLHLNGNQALAYARLRYIGNSDYERTERQRKVIAEMIKKSRSMNIVEMDKLATRIFPQIKTDVTKSELAQLLVDMLDYRNYEIQELRVPSDGTFSDATIDGMSVLMVDFNANAEIFRETVYGSIDLDDEGNETDMTIE